MELTLHALGGYCALLQERGLLAAPLPELPLNEKVRLVSYNSQEVIPGTLFLCKGARFRAEYLAQAKKRGALAYLSERTYSQVDLPCILVGDMRKAIAPMADLYYNHPSEKLKVIGVTGTKGKSSTAYYLKYILDEYLTEQGKSESGVISSIDTYDGAERFESHLTTPEPLELQKHFANAHASGIPYLTMEVSSQALKYHRTLCTRFAAACFLNISPDHISPIEHPDFEDYFASKLKIFAQAKVNCVNLDCDRAGEVLTAAKAAGAPVLTFSQNDPTADVYARDVQKQGGDILFRVTSARYDRRFRLTMPGLFNVENALAAIAVCQALGVPERCVYVGLMKARVPGRMEVYSNADNTVAAIVDYAHNKISFETLFRSVQTEYPGRKIVAVFGCPGGKAFDRRRDLGEISGAYADKVILTEEDSGEEDTLSICKEIAGHVQARGCPWEIEPNRGEAIRQAILSCKEESVLLITGKGAETRQKRGTRYVDCPSDVDYVHTFLREYDARHGLDGLEKVRGLVALLPILSAQRDKTVAVALEGEAGETVRQDLDVLETAGVRADPLPDQNTAVKADRFFLLAPGGGVRLDSGNEKTALAHMDVKYARELLNAGLIAGDTAAQVGRCLQALQNGAEDAAILDAGAEHALLLAMLGQRVNGTIITR